VRNPARPNVARDRLVNFRIDRALSSNFRIFPFAVIGKRRYLGSRKRPLSRTRVKTHKYRSALSPTSPISRHLPALP